MTYSPQAAIKAAAAEIGYREHGTNDTRYNRWLGPIPGYPHGGYGYPWCASFQAWVADQAGGQAGHDFPRTAGCLAAVAWFEQRGRFTTKDSPRPGDWVFYGEGGGTHVELVADVAAGTITTIGGNTSGTLAGTYYAGDGVYRKTVSRNEHRIHGYGRPLYQEEDMPLTRDDAKKVWGADIIPAPPGPDGKVPAGNPTWKPESYLRETLMAVRRIGAQVAALAGDQVDEREVARLVLAGLTPSAIAESVVSSLPDELAAQVAQEIGARLARSSA